MPIARLETDSDVVKLGLPTARLRAAIAALLLILAAGGAWWQAESADAASTVVSYRTVVLADAPAGYWRLGEASGNTAATETGANSGSYSGSPTLGQTGALAGDANKAVRFDGVNDQVSVGNASSLNNRTALSLETWVNPTSLPSGSNLATLLSRGNQYLLSLDSTGAVVFNVWRNSTSQQLKSPAGLVPTGSWHHVVATYSGSALTIFVDGTARATSALTGTLDSSNSSLTMGARSSSARLVGTLDEAAVYGTALSVTRVQQHYLAGTDTTPPAVTLSQPPNGSATANLRPTLSGAAGTATGDSTTVTVKIYAGSSATGTPLQTVTTTRSGSSWSSTPSSDLVTGTYTVLAEQADAAGNIGQTSSATFSVDATPPAVTLTQPSNGASIPNARPALAGAAGNLLGDGTTVTVKIYSGATASGTPVGSIDTTRLGSFWSTAPTSDLSPGTYTLRAQQSDAAGNLGLSSASTITIQPDTAPPAVSLTQPQDGAGTSNLRPALSGAAGDLYGDSGTVTVKIYSGPTATGTPTQTLDTTRTGASWSTAPSSDLAPGTYTARAEQSDAAGNLGQSAAATFAVDTTAPAVTLTQPATGTVTSNLRPTLSGTAGEAAGDSGTVTVKIYSGPTATGTPTQTLNTTRTSAAWSTAPSSDLAPGTYTARAEQSDAAGNLGQSAASSFRVGTYRGVVLADTPLAYWRLAEVSGTTAAEDTGFHPGSYLGEPAMGQSGALYGDSNPAVRFDGTNDQVNVSNSSRLNTRTALTLEAWVKPAAPPTGTALDPILARGNQYQLSLDSAGAVVFNVWRGTKRELKSSAGLVPTGSWRHVVATYNGSSLTIYVDGTARATAALTGTLDSDNATLNIGARSSARLDGTLDEAAVYGSALSAARVQQHYLAGIDTTPPAVTLTEPSNGAGVALLRPPLSGTAGDAAGDSTTVSVKIYSGPTASGTPVQTLTTTRTAASWSTTPSSDLAPGTYTARAEQSDAAGNLGQSAAVTFTVLADTTPPAVTLTQPQDGTTTSEPRPTFSGAAGDDVEDFDTVRVMIYAGTDTSEEPLGSIVTTRSGASWSTIPTSDLSPGTYTALARQSDEAGNTGQSGPSTFSVEADTTLPVVGLSQPADGAMLSDPRPQFSGAAGDAAGDSETVTLKIFSGTDTSAYPIESIDTDRTGASWSASPSADLPEGTYSALAEQSDVDGNEGQSPTTTFFIDTSAPAVTLTQPAPGSVTSNVRPALSGAAGNAVGDGATVTVKIHAGSDTSGTLVQTLSATRGGNAWSATPSTDLAFGMYTARAEQSDALGHLGQSAASTFVVGTYRDTVMLDSPRAYWRLGEASGTAAADELVSNPGTYLNGPSLGQAGVIGGDPNTAVGFDGVNDEMRVNTSSTVSPTAALSLEAWVRPNVMPSGTATLIRKDGQYLLRITSAGAVILRIWANGTQTELTSPGGLISAGGWQHVVGTYDGSNMRIYVNGVERASRSLTGPVATTANSLYVGSSGGSDWVNARIDEPAVYGSALSAARVQAHYDRAFLIDADPPVVTLTQPADGATTTNPRPELSGSAGNASTDGATVTVKIYSGPTATGTPTQTLNTTRTSASWSTAPSSDLAPGTYTARAEQSDAAANLGQSSTSTFTVQALPPDPSYRDITLSDSPRAYWRLGEASGTAAADELVSNPGTYLNGPSLGQAGVIGGDPNTAVGFDGVNDEMRVNTSSTVSPTAALSLEAWVRPNVMPSGTATLIRKDGQYLLRITSAGAVILRIWANGTQTELTSPGGLISAGGWQHVVGTYDGSNMRIYVNGVERASRSLTGPVATTANSLYVGSSGGSDWVNARIDEPAVYGSALSAARVQAHYDRAFLIDADPPTIDLKTPTNGSVMESMPNFGGIAATGPGDTDAVTVRLYAGSSATGSPIQTLNTTRRSSGVFSVLASSALSSGTYTAQAQQADSTGNVGQSAARTFTVDAAADPTVLAAGDIASCSSTFTGDEATAQLLDGLGGTVLALGDTAYDHGTPAEYANCYDPTWGRHLARTRSIVGDHEYDSSSSAAGYFGYFGAAAGPAGANMGYYSYDIGAWHVVALNSYCYENGTCTAMEDWLSDDLAAHPATCTLALYHEPLFSSGNVHGNNLGSEYLWEIMYQAGVDLELAGSEHIYERFAPQTPSGVLDPTNGIRQITVGTGGYMRYAIGNVQSNSEVRNADTWGILQLKLHSASYDWQFIPEAGKTFTDSGSASCH